MALQTLNNLEPRGDFRTKLNENFNEVYVDSAIVSTSGSTITLDMALKTARQFIGSAVIATPKSIVTSNDTNANVYDFHFEISNIAGVLTFDDSIMADLNWNVATKEWTPPSIGKYEGGATWDGTSWKLKINGPFL